MHDEATQLFALESEAAQAEAQLERELAAACQAAEQAAQRRAHLLSAAQQLCTADAEAGSVGSQLSQLTVPRFDDEPVRAESLRVRRLALSQRRAAGDAFRSALEAFRRGTAELELQLGHQAQWLARAQQRLETRAAAPVVPSVPRRQAPRVALHTQVDLGSDSNFYAGFSTNLSESGIFIATLSTPPRGTQVELTFTLPGGGPLKARGVVCWTREVNDATPDIMPGAGVQFLELPPEVAASISEFVMKRDPMFYAE